MRLWILPEPIPFFFPFSLSAFFFGSASGRANEPASQMANVHDEKTGRGNLGSRTAGIDRPLPLAPETIVVYHAQRWAEVHDGGGSGRYLCTRLLRVWYTGWLVHYFFLHFFP